MQTNKAEMSSFAAIVRQSLQPIEVKICNDTPSEYSVGFYIYCHFLTFENSHQNNSQQTELQLLGYKNRLNFL